MVKKRRREEACSGAWRVTKRIFEFYALLATQFFLRRRRIRRQGVRRYVRVSVTALFICLFKCKIFDFVFQRVSPRTFCPGRFLG